MIVCMDTSPNNADMTVLRINLVVPCSLTQMLSKCVSEGKITDPKALWFVCNTKAIAFRYPATFQYPTINRTTFGYIIAQGSVP